MKEDCPPSAHVPISDSKSILKSELLSLLKTYNCYHEGRSLQLRHREEEEVLIIEGLLNIAWGLRRPIRLQIQDDRERVQLSASWMPGRPSCHPKEPPLQDDRAMAQEQGDQPTAREESSRASSEPLEEEEETPQLMRTRSDAAGVIRRRPRHCAPGDAQRIWRHRFSINGHFYNHKTSVFTPAYGSVTNVRVNTTMTARHVLILLLNKFRVENGPSEFALYVVHESGERTKLKDSEYPLISRILHGPCEKIARIFLMEADLGEEVPHDVPGPAHDDAAASAAAGGDPVAHGHTEDQWAEADQGPPAGSPTSSRCLSTCLRTLSPVALALGPRAFTGPRARPRGQELTGWGLCVGLACTVSSPKVEALAILCDWMVWLFPFSHTCPAQESSA